MENSTHRGIYKASFSTPIFFFISIILLSRLVVVLLKMSDMSLRLLHQMALPFANAEIIDTSVTGLLEDGQVKYKYARDGIIKFHSIKICSSNAKALSNFFQVSLGFYPIAYQGLETGNYYLASHVISNGNILIEIVSPLHSKEISETTSYILGDGESDIIKIVEMHIDSFAETHPKFEVDKQLVKKSILDKYIIVREIERRKDHSVSEDDDFHGDETVQTYQRRVLAKKIALERLELIKVQNFIAKHGDGVLDIALLVESTVNTFERAIKAGAIEISKPRFELDNFGSAFISIIGVPITDIQHSLIQDIDGYSGPFLPNYGSANDDKDDLFYDLLDSLSNIKLISLDHCVENFTWGQMMDQAKFYAKAFGFHKFWSVDEADVATGNSSLKSIVMASSNGKVKIPINEPGEGGTKRGQIEEFYDFNEGPGIQHLAFRTYNIIGTVRSMIERGVEFNIMGDNYYEELIQRMSKDDVKIREDIIELQQLRILVDYDPTTRNPKTRICNYILQIFTKPLSDRPTLFLEIIQRNHHNGFGKGTFKGLFETIEAQQRLRGTLTDKV